MQPKQSFLDNRMQQLKLVWEKAHEYRHLVRILKEGFYDWMDYDFNSVTLLEGQVAIAWCVMPGKDGSIEVLAKADANRDLYSIWLQPDQVEVICRLPDEYLEWRGRFSSGDRVAYIEHKKIGQSTDLANGMEGVITGVAYDIDGVYIIVRFEDLNASRYVIPYCLRKIERGEE